VPFLTGNSYNSLQGLNASLADTITFNGFSPVAGANESGIFITITKISDNSVALSTDELTNSTTSLNIPANTLAAGTTYNLEVDYSSRLDSTSIGGVPFTAGYDVRTEISFTTAAPAAVPEPASLALMAIGVASAVLVARRRRIRPSA
jgi:PEP-CTERM motif